MGTSKLPFIATSDFENENFWVFLKFQGNFNNALSFGQNPDGKYRNPPQYFPAKLNFWAVRRAPDIMSKSFTVEKLHPHAQLSWGKACLLICILVVFSSLPLTIMVGHTVPAMSKTRPPMLQIILPTTTTGFIDAQLNFFQ